MSHTLHVYATGNLPNEMCSAFMNANLIRAMPKHEYSDIKLLNISYVHYNNLSGCFCFAYSHFCI